MHKKIKYGLAILTFSLFSFSQAYAQEQNLQQRIANKGTIYVGTEGAYAPYTFHDKSGKLTGYDVEVTRAIGKELGVKVEFKETQWDAMFAGLNSERFDMIANQIVLSTPERRAKYSIATPYCYSGAVVAARQDAHINSWNDIKGLFAAQTLKSNYTQIARQHGANLVNVAGLANSLQLVKQKRVDITVNDSLAILDYINTVPHSGLKIVLRSEHKEGSGLVLLKKNTAALAPINLVKM